MVVPRPPAALDLDVLAVELPVGIEVDAAVVGVVSAHDDSSPVADDVHRLSHRFRNARRLDDDIRATTTRDAAHGVGPGAGGDIEPDGPGGAHATRIVQ